MNFSELKVELQVKLQDTSDDIASRLGGWINDTVDVAIDLADVPGFKTMASVNTVLGQAYLNLPSAFDGRLLYVGDTSGDLDLITLDELIERYPTMAEVGNVAAVAREGSLLYYQPIPSAAESLLVLYRRKATRMVLATSVPEGLPEYLHRQVIISGAASFGFDMIEDGLEDGDKTNTNAQRALFEDGLTLLREWVAKRRLHVSRSVWRY